MANILGLRWHLTRATCVISGCTAEKNTGLLEYRTFPPHVGGQKVIKDYVFRSINLLTLKDFYMITPETTTIIILSLLAVLMSLPLIEIIPRVGKIVSLRWAIVAIVVTLMVAVILDFAHLSEDIRKTVIVGGLCTGGLWIVARSVEKALFNGFFAKAGKVEIDVDDKKLTIEGAEVGEKEVQKPASAEDSNAKEQDDLKGLAEREHNA